MYTAILGRIRDNKYHKYIQDLLSISTASVRPNTTSPHSSEVERRLVVQKVGV